MKIMLPLMLTNKKQPLPGTQVHRAEDDTTRVPARDNDTGGLTASAPVGTQRRKQKQVGLVFHQQHTALRQLPDSAADSPFFSPVPDPVPARIGAVSTRNPVGP